MRKFKSIETGAILVPNNKEVIEQLAKSKYYVEIGVKAQSTEDKAIEDYTVKELVAYLTELGIECNNKMKKTDLLALVPNDNNEDDE